MENKNSNRIISIPIIIALSIIVGMYIARFTGFSSSTGTSNFGTSKGQNKIDLILDYIDKEYVDTISQEDLIEKTIPKLLEQLDPHSAYIPASDFDEVNDPLEGEFEGIGVQFNVQHDTVVIIQVIPGGPSERVNIKAGDRIVTVNDSTIAGIKITSNKVVKLLKGPKGTKVKVGIKRRGYQELLDFVITRDKIPFYSIDASYMVNQNTGYLKISRFAMTTYDEFMEHTSRLKSSGMKKLILDLRSNGGGILDAAINIADEFLDGGKTIVYTEGKAYPRYDYISKTGGSCSDIELVILINEESASASEVLAGAIQDNDRGQIIGRRSFGKGLVMSQKEFTDHSAVRLTISRYYTATGRCIQKPYEENITDYYTEIYKRDAYHDDTTKFPDSLKYTTTGGKIVYGGGGIMPDFYVSIDTSEYTELYSTLIGKGILYDYAFEFSDEHRKDLETFRTIEEIKSYLNNKNALTASLTYAKNKGIKIDSGQLKISENLIKNRLYSYIIRNILDDKGFYPVINEADETLKKAVEILNKN